MAKTQVNITPQELKTKFTLPSLKAANYCLAKASGLSGVKSAIKAKYSVKTARKASLDLSKKRSVIKAMKFLNGEEQEKPKDKRIGNRFWEARSSHGRTPKFESPEQLWDACVEYFIWVEENPLMSSELVKYQGEAKVAEVPKMRAMTISGLCLFLDIDQTTWGDYRKKKDFTQVTTRAEETIYNQKFAGASAELLNANIIARDLGLTDKQDITAKVKTRAKTKIVFQGVQGNNKKKK